jgi:hypothetical protein
VAVSASVGKETVSLPLVMDAATRQASVKLAQFYEENARKKVAFSAMVRGLEIEPGDLVALTDLGGGFDGEVFKVTETLHGANYVVECTAEAILRCTVYAPEQADPHYQYVLALFHFDGSFADSSLYSNQMGAYGHAHTTSSIAKFGGSLALDGTGDGLIAIGNAFVSVPFSATNTTPYTIECFAYFDAVNRTQCLVAMDSGLGGKYFSLQQFGDDELVYQWGTGIVYTASLGTTGANIAAGQWYHVAVDKDSTGTIRIYVGGVMFAKDTPANSVIATTGMGGAPLSIGMTGLQLNSFDGYIDEVRITKDVSRYGSVYGDSSFTPPTSAFQP